MDQDARPIGQPVIPVYESPMYLPSGDGLNVWDIYNQKAALADADLTQNFNGSMDVLLVFVSTQYHMSNDT